MPLESTRCFRQCVGESAGKLPLVHYPEVRMMLFDFDSPIMNEISVLMVQSVDLRYSSVIVANFLRLPYFVRFEL